VLVGLGAGAGVRPLVIADLFIGGITADLLTKGVLILPSAEGITDDLLIGARVKSLLGLGAGAGVRPLVIADLFIGGITADLLTKGVLILPSAEGITDDLLIGAGARAKSLLGLDAGARSSLLLGLGAGARSSLLLGLGAGAGARVKPLLGLGAGARSSLLLGLGAGARSSLLLGLGAGCASLLLGLGLVAIRLSSHEFCLF
jgi:hypothetical protein